MISRLRRGELSIRQVERLLDARKKYLADARKLEKYAGLTPDEIKSVETAEKNASLQSRLNELGQKVARRPEFAADELKKGGTELKEFLANRGIIPAGEIHHSAGICRANDARRCEVLVQELSTLRDEARPHSPFSRAFTLPAKTSWIR